MLWRRRTGAPWRALPERDGPWHTLDDRGNRSRPAGTLDRLLAARQCRLERTRRFSGLGGHRAQRWRRRRLLPAPCLAPGPQVLRRTCTVWLVAPALADPQPPCPPPRHVSGRQPTAGGARWAGGVPPPTPTRPDAQCGRTAEAVPAPADDARSPRARRRAPDTLPDRGPDPRRPGARRGVAPLHRSVRRPWPPPGRCQRARLGEPLLCHAVPLLPPAPKAPGRGPPRVDRVHQPWGASRREGPRRLAPARAEGPPPRPPPLSALPRGGGETPAPLPASSTEAPATAPARLTAPTASRFVDRLEQQRRPVRPTEGLRPHSRSVLAPGVWPGTHAAARSRGALPPQDACGRLAGPVCLPLAIAASGGGRSERPRPLPLTGATHREGWRAS
jgi:hypothetical protein